jgi:hypothetical protein
LTPQNLFLQEILDYWKTRFNDHPKLSLMKANISLFKLGHRWQSIYNLLDAKTKNGDVYVEHSSYLISKIIEKELKLVDIEDVNKQGIDVTSILSFQRLSQKFMIHISEFIDQYQVFWLHLMSDAPDRIKMQKMSITLTN